ncbi:hypothetical protein [Streptomyces sp. NPDC059455]|uniref:hypothetical protein n=1 Tax=Streptomyces sp. NPDC059455 TaxID=3346837 RepID=UPI0036814F40
MGKLSPDVAPPRGSPYRARPDAHCVLHTHARRRRSPILRMYYLDKACEIQTTAMAGGAKLSTPPPDICELTARQLSGEDHGSDFRDDQAYPLARSALLRLVERIAPDHRN